MQKQHRMRNLGSGVELPFTVTFRSSSDDDATDTRHPRISAAAHRLLSNIARRRPPPLCTMAPLRARQLSRWQSPDPTGRIRRRLPASLCQSRRLPRCRRAPPRMRSPVPAQHAVRLRKLKTPRPLPHAGSLVLHRRSNVRRTVLLSSHTAVTCAPGRPGPAAPTAAATGYTRGCFTAHPSCPPLNPQLTSPKQPLTYPFQFRRSEQKFDLTGRQHAHIAKTACLCRTVLGLESPNCDLCSASVLPRQFPASLHTADRPFHEFPWTP